MQFIISVRNTTDFEGYMAKDRNSLCALTMWLQERNNVISFIVHSINQSGVVTELPRYLGFGENGFSKWKLELFEKNENLDIVGKKVK